MRAVLDGLLERLEHIEIIFARSTLCHPPYKTASIRFLCIQEKKRDSPCFPKRLYDPILDINIISLINLALALAATVTTQQTIHGPTLFAKLDVAAVSLDEVSCVNGAADEEDKKDDSAHDRMR
jgi:hypothetical protein